MGHHLIIVEGAADQAFLSNILVKIFNFKKATVTNNPVHTKGISHFWVHTWPKSVPVGDDFENPINIPKYFSSSLVYGEQICVFSANGFDKICSTIGMLVKGFGTNIKKLSSLVVFVDSDGESVEQISKRFQPVQEQLDKCFPDIGVVESPNILKRGLITTGVYIMPRHDTCGTLENLLLECAESTYNYLFTTSQSFLATTIKTLDETMVDKDCIKSLSKDAGHAKAQVSIIASILKPGCSFTTSLFENHWFRNVKDNGDLKLMIAFLQHLFGVSSGGEVFGWSRKCWKCWNISTKKAIVSVDSLHVLIGD